MSWLARSIANTLRLDDYDGQENEDEDAEEGDRSRIQHDVTVSRSSRDPNAFDSTPLREENADFEEVNLDDDRDCEGDSNDDVDESDNQGQSRGVKEDLSELKETFTRQLWGVASFLAPPPPPPPPPLTRPVLWSQRSDRFDHDYEWAEDADRNLSGEDLEEREVECERESPKFDVRNSHLHCETEDPTEDVAGITEEVLAFAKNIAHHPETWLDFPLSEEEEFDDFEISEEQYKHTLAVEQLAPSLAALRIELCPAHMSAGYFWMVYFVLLHSRLSKHDDDILSTPQLAEARARWREELQKRTKPESDWFGRNITYMKETTGSSNEDFSPRSFEDNGTRFFYQRTNDLLPTSHLSTNEYEAEKHMIEQRVGDCVDKSVIEEELAGKTQEKHVVSSSSYKLPLQDFDDDEDDWLEENSDLEGYSANADVLGNGEDVSFSDLEEDIDYAIPVKSKDVLNQSSLSKTS